MADDQNWYVGDSWTPIARITDPNNDEALVDPEHVTVTVNSPGGAATPMTRISAGLYGGVEIDLTSAGVWRIVVKGSGGFKAVQPEDITVLDPFAVT